MPVERAATPDLHLVSHKLCPYVQRAVIALTEKGVPFRRSDVDLSAKPDWFLAISPLGRTPVLVTKGVPIFESAVILEYLDETEPPRLHPADAIERATQRSWIEFGSAVLNDIAGFYAAPDAEAFASKTGALRRKFERLDSALGDGPYFAGPRFGLVDTVFGPVFRYFDTFDRIADSGILDGLPRVSGWRVALAARPSVRDAVSPDYPDLLRDFLLRRGSHLSRLMAAETA
ncbi:glutathione S-transferase family protein [Rhodobacterales bacterium HKCCE2091]|nr:glutathione S-transferase family protein [Rhodobacterales bacterium HKCCE2091]